MSYRIARDEYNPRYPMIVSNPARVETPLNSNWLTLDRSLAIRTEKAKLSSVALDLTVDVSFD